MEVARIDFVASGQNLVFVGAPDTGKTGLAIALLQKALIEGYGGRFYNAQELLDKMYSSLADFVGAEEVVPLSAKKRFSFDFL